MLIINIDGIKKELKHCYVLGEKGLYKLVASMPNLVIKFSVLYDSETKVVKTFENKAIGLLEKGVFNIVSL